MKNPFEIYTSSIPKGNRRPLDWDESALDSQSYVEGVHDSERSAPNLAWLWAFLILSLAILTSRIFYLQIIRGPSFRLLSENNRIRKQTILAPRGLIKDRNGQPLVQNTAGFNLAAAPFDLPKEGLQDELNNLAATFGLDPGELADKLKNINRNSIDLIVIKQDISDSQSILFQTKASEFVGFSVQSIPIRQYLNAPVFSHVLGYTGLLSPADLGQLDKTKYGAVDVAGKSGVELEYEKFLHGVNGENLAEVDAAGRLLDVLGENPPIPGQTLILNIDKGLQEKLYDELNSKVGNKKAAAVALNPKNGQVLAFLSLPGFDNNLFARGIKPQEYQNLLSDKKLPLFDRALAGLYPPGSTVKPMVAIAGLETGVIDEKIIINDRGQLAVPNQFDASQQYVFHGWKPDGLGAMTVRSAIALSSDIFFYALAGGYPGSAVPDGLGAQVLADWYRKFNLGQATGIDIAGEKSGLVPDPAWKAEYFKNDPILSKWYLGDTYHLGIGQGDLLVTPLQVAEWTAIIANNGTGFKPQIANRILDDSGNIVMQLKPEVLVSSIASLSNIKIVQEGMRQTVLAGTAKALQSLPITSAGKTGTSQFDGSNPLRTHAWFTAYAPYENPQIVITVLVEAGGEGNAVAEPVVKDALQWWAENRYKK